MGDFAIGWTPPNPEKRPRFEVIIEDTANHEADSEGNPIETYDAGEVIRVDPWYKKDGPPRTDPESVQAALRKLGISDLTVGARLHPLRSYVDQLQTVESQCRVGMSSLEDIEEEIGKVRVFALEARITTDEERITRILPLAYAGYLDLIAYYATSMTQFEGHYEEWAFEQLEHVRHCIEGCAEKAGLEISEADREIIRSSYRKICEQYLAEAERVTRRNDLKRNGDLAGKYFSDQVLDALTSQIRRYAPEVGIEIDENRLTNFFRINYEKALQEAGQRQDRETADILIDIARRSASHAGMDPDEAKIRRILNSF